ncbi:MAG TPA: tetratricopeptide repeat protein [Streptosporangiaceae bacterium]|nr:tetratricopeptide repeat protein [Streptosporangiaceae bacterium]
MSVDGRVRADDPAGVAGGQVRWPVRSGMLPALTEGFVARPESAPGLGQVLAPGTAVALTPARSARAAVQRGAPDWAGSVGKTQLAVYFAETLWQAREIELLVWVNAASRVTILSAYAAAAAAALGVDPSGDAEAVAARFVGWLDETSRAWLVVLDDVSSAQDVEGLWPVGPSGRTLVTTSESPASLGREHLQSFPMSGLSRREALSYLLGRLTEDRGQRTGAIDLVDILGGEPLALGQASAVLDSSTLSCRDYLDQYLRKREHLSPSIPGRPAATAITWTLCVEHAARLLPKGPVQQMLILAAVLDGHSIPGTIFTTAAARDFAGGAAVGLTNPEEAWACVTSLATAGLLRIEQPTGSAGAGTSPPVVRMHQALQAAVRSASSRETLERAALAAADALLEAWPAEDAGSWLADSLRSAAASIMALAGDRLWAGSGYRILFRSGQSLEDAHLTMLAAAHWNHMAAASDRFLGAEHADSLAASDHLAESFLAAGRGIEALPWFRRVLSNRVSLLGPDHQETTGFEMRMGQALLAAGGAEEAIGLFERVASDRSKLAGPAHPDTLDARDALADAYCAAGRVREGIRQYQRTLAEREKAQGKNHQATLATCQKLADAYLGADQVKESLSAYKRVASGRERTLGGEHPDTIAARSRLASAYQSAGRMAIAVQLHEQARADSERVLGSDHVDTLARRVLLAHAYYAVGRLGDATSLLRDTAGRCDRVLSPGDPLTRAVHESLTNIAGG